MCAWSDDIILYKSINIVMPTPTLVSVLDYRHVFEQTPYNNTLTKTWIWNSCFSIGQQGGGPDFGRSIYQPRAFTQCYRSFRQRSSVSLPRWRFGKQNGNKKLWSRITNPSFFCITVKFLAHYFAICSFSSNRAPLYDNIWMLHIDFDPIF